MSGATLLVIFILYMLPSVVAATRGHPNTAPIVVINVFGGWTLVGWVAALAWSVSRVKHDPNHKSVLQQWEGK